MTEKEVIKKAMTETSTTQLELAQKLGYKTQSAISSKLKAEKLDTNVFIKMLDAMGYTVKVCKDGTDWVLKA